MEGDGQGTARKCEEIEDVPDASLGCHSPVALFFQNLGQKVKMKLEKKLPYDVGNYYFCLMLGSKVIRG